MPDPVKFTIAAANHLWVLNRDGAELARFSHLEQATHEAVRHARDLEETGQPAQVLVEAAGGKIIEIESGPETTQRQERESPDDAD